VTESTRINLNVNVLNLFDQDTPTAYQLRPYRDSFNMSDPAFFAGFDPVALAAATPSIRREARFRQASSFQNRRSIRFGLRYSF
jgi:outer membrane receptor protein involved in Fe transport